MAENKNLPTSAGDMGLIPGPGRSPSEKPVHCNRSPPLDTIRESLRAARETQQSPKNNEKKKPGNTVL